MRLLSVFLLALLAGACFGRTRSVTSTVDANREESDLRSCITSQLQTLGYTVSNPTTPPGAMQGVKQSGMGSDRIDISITERSDRVVVGKPAFALAATARTFNSGGAEQSASEAVRRDASQVLTCGSGT